MLDGDIELCIRAQACLFRHCLLQPDSEGGVFLEFDVSAPSDLLGKATSTSPWKIDNLELELAGTTLGP